jgi:hypothetical protein
MISMGRFDRPEGPIVIFHRNLLYLYGQGSLSVCFSSDMHCAYFSYCLLYFLRLDFEFSIKLRSINYFTYSWYRTITYKVNLFFSLLPSSMLHGLPPIVTKALQAASLQLYACKKRLCDDLSLDPIQNDHEYYWRRKDDAFQLSLFFLNKLQLRQLMLMIFPGPPMSPQCTIMRRSRLGGLSRRSRAKALESSCSLRS